MATRPTGRARRRTANERFRQGFLAQASAQLHELSQLLSEEPDSGDSVAFELRRLSETAEALQLATIARAAEDAADELEKPSGSLRALRRVANAIRHTGGRLRFGPLVIVGADPAQADRLSDDAQLCCEPVKLFDDLPSFASGLHTEQPTAVVLPVDAVDAVHQLVNRERFPVLVHGPASAWEQRLHAMEAGAHGFLVHPFVLADVTRLARWRAQPQEETFEVLLLADESRERDELAQALEQVGIAVVTATDLSELAVALEAGTPRAVVLGARVAGRPAVALAQLIRTHPRCNHLPILVSGRPDEPALLRALGVDDVMRADAASSQAAQRVRDRVLRLQALPWERDPVSGLANRLGVLNALDAELAKASRTGQVLSVVLVELQGLRQAVELFGAAAPRNARRHLVGLLRDGLRRTDLYGELALGELLVALPGCDREVALRRLEAIGEAFREQCRRDAQLKQLQVVVGAADTESGLLGVALRAEGELRANGGRAP
jgi:DNA-binding response OmpR family regulator